MGAEVKRGGGGVIGMTDFKRTLDPFGFTVFGLFPIPPKWILLSLSQTQIFAF